MVGTARVGCGRGEWLSITLFPFPSDTHHARISSSHYCHAVHLVQSFFIVVATVPVVHIIGVVVDLIVIIF